MGPVSFQVQILGPKMCYAPTESWMLYNFCFVKFLPSFMLESVEPPWPQFGLPNPRFRVRSKARSLPSQLFGRCTTTFDYNGSRRPRSFQIQIMDPKMWFAPSKIEVLFNFSFITFLSRNTVEAAEPLHPHFAPPRPLTPQLGSRVSPGCWNQVDYWESALQLLF
jgi:hypothetical protein